MRATNRPKLALSMLLVAVMSVSTAFAAEKVFDKKFSATAGGTLTVDTEGGAITVNGADVREVTVHATVSGTANQVDDFAITAERRIAMALPCAARAMGLGGWTCRGYSVVACT